MDSADDPAPTNATRGAYARVARFAVHLWKVTTRAALVLLLLLLTIPLYSAIFDRSFVIGEFSVPDELQKSGVTSNVVGRLFFDRIAEMHRIAKSAVAESQLGSRSFGANSAASKVADIKLPGADISLLTLVSQLRALLHIEDTKIVGEIVVSKRTPGATTYLVRAHATGSAMGGDIWVEREEGSDVSALVQEVAKRLVERFDPLVAGFFYFRAPAPPDKDLDRAIGFADGFHSQDATQQAGALVLRGLALQEKRQEPEAVQASLCAAIARDPSFTPAWRILAAWLRERNASAEAHDLALRLIHDQPGAPEGYRQLGALRGNCMAGPDHEKEADQSFQNAIERGKNPERTMPDYLSRVDYANFLYTWYGVDKQHSSPNRPGAMVDYMSAAEEVLKEAQDKASDEPSVFATSARLLGHPRDFGEPQNARHARLLEAELKARYALTRDSASPFANLVLAEVLTEEAVDSHKYLSEPKYRQKFQQAKEYLELSRRGVGRSDALYEAIYARALAGLGEFTEAEKVLRPFEHTKTPVHLVEWVRGEMLYNQNRHKEALAALERAQSVRTCGPRSNAVSDLISRVRGEMAKPDKAGEPVASLVTMRSVAATDLPDPRPACPQWDTPASRERAR
jgi:tetratricopeptide (TPR) repeat protein